MSWKLATLSIALPAIVVVAILFVRPRKAKTASVLSSTSQVFSIVEDDKCLSNPGPSSKVMGTWTSLGLEQPVVIAMVGLPARGKSYIVKLLVRYLKWNGFDADVFNVGSYRRKIGLASADASFFSSSNGDALRKREDMAVRVQDILYSWIHQHSETSKGKVAIFDATNTTKERRLALAERARRENVFLLFVESICDDETVLQQNYALKLENDDYKHTDKKTAMRDFLERVQAYEKVYETISDDEDNNQISYIKLINVGQKVITRNCTGYLPSQVAFYLQNIHILPRRIYLSLNSEVDPISNRLTEDGLQYSLELAKYIYARQETVTDLSKDVFVLAGTTEVHAETILHLRNIFPCYHSTLLNEIRPGEVRLSGEKTGKAFGRFDGESYADVIERIRPVIIELERQRRTVVVVCHLSILRCIYAYFMGTSLDEIPLLQFSQHTVYQLTPGPFGCKCDQILPYEELRDL